MKTVQSIVVAASILLVSAGAVADSLNAASGTARSESNTLVLSAAQTKQAAYKMGLNRLAQLKTSSPQQLSQVLKVHSSNPDGTTLHLNSDSSYVTVQERMDASGNVSYVGIVNVSFQYSEKSSR